MHKNKEELLFHFENSIDFVKNLVKVSEELWRTPIATGKWTVAEVIGHITPWDEFLLKERLPYLFKNTQMSQGPNVEELNHESALASRNRSKDETISKFINLRRYLVVAINNMDDELWEKELKFGGKALSLYDYLKSFMEHDLHHFEQIDKVIIIESHL